MTQLEILDTKIDLLSTYGELQAAALVMILGIQDKALQKAPHVITNSLMVLKPIMAALHKVANASEGPTYRWAINMLETQYNNAVEKLGINQSK